MTAAWPNIRIGDLLARSEETAALAADAKYNEITVRLWGKGVVSRGSITGAEIASQRRFLAREGQFILSRIDARNGASGVVPPELDAAVVTNDFPLFNVNSDRLLPAFLGWLCRTEGFVQKCRRASEGTTNRVRLQESKFLAMEIPIPPIPEQERVVYRLGQVNASIQRIRATRMQAANDMRGLLTEAFWSLATAAPRCPMTDVAPLIRRPVNIDLEFAYPELGIRSFGNGTFHKPALTGFELGNKRIFKIEAGDLIFSNVFAWEGGIAVAQPEDAARFGSHRFITCLAKRDVATSNFLCFYFLTDEGLDKIRLASPGGAGRNRTLGLAALEKIEVPVPPLKQQNWFDELELKVKNVRDLHTETGRELEAVLPSVLSKTFAGEL